MKCVNCGEDKNRETDFYPALEQHGRKAGKIPYGGGARLDVCIECVELAERDHMRLAVEEMNLWKSSTKTEG